MDYIYEYDIAAVFFIIVVIINFLKNKTIETNITKVFTNAIITILFASAFDLISNICINNPTKYPLWVNYITLVIFYLTYHAIPLFYYLIILIVTEQNNLSWVKRDLIYLPYIFDCILIFLSPFCKTLFYYDKDFNYHYGSCFVLLYIFAAYYILSTLWVVFKNGKNLLPSKRKVIYIFTGFCILIVFIQIFFTKYSIMCFADSIAAYFLYRALKNPEEYRDLDLDIYNKYGFKTVISQILEKNSKKKNNIIVFQIYGLEYVSSVAGEEVRFLVLKQIINLLKMSFNKKNIFSYSNNQFAIILPYDKKVLDSSIDKIKLIFNDKLRINDLYVSLSVRICYFSIPDDVNDYETVFDVIDCSLKQFEKNTSRNIFHASRDVLEIQKRENYIVKILAEAYINDGFEVNYQPIYSLKEHRFVAAEAFLRFKNPELKNLSPEEFIPLAEKSEFILQLGDFVLESVCKFIKETQVCEEKLKCIFINLSNMQCMQDNFVARFLKIIDSYGIDRKCIVFDVRDLSSLIFRSDFEKKKLYYEKENISFALDHFGYQLFDIMSIINYPIKYVKIDKELLWRAEKNESLKNVLAHFIKMIEVLNMKVIVQGVETKSQLEMLEKLDCNYIQGFYYLKATPANNFIKLLELNV